MRFPLVSAITPTWERNNLLLDRCIPSVQAQDYPHVEHVVVSDGPDLSLRGRYLRGALGVQLYAELDGHDPERHWGAAARRRGIELSSGELIAYLDDDDAWQPGHVTVLARALAGNPDAQFAFSRAMAHDERGSVTVRMGDGRPAHGRIVSSMIMHRRELLDLATWEPHPAEDWVLVERWLAAGAQYESVDAVTADYYPSMPLDFSRDFLVSLPPVG